MTFWFRCDDGYGAFGVQINEAGVIVYEGRAERWRRWLGKTWAELKAGGVAWYPTGVERSR